VDFDAVVEADTIVLFMAVKTLPDCVARLLSAGRAPTTPAAVIRWGTTAAQQTVVGTLADIVARVEAAALLPPALVVIGEVVRLRERIAWYEKRPLFGMRVLVPRQREQAQGFARSLVRMGAEPILCEVTRIVEGDPQALDAVLGTLPGAFDWVAFTSANAVERTMAALLRAGRDTRSLAGVRVAAVGAATADALARVGLRADLVPDKKDGAGVAAAILAVSERPTGLRVLLPRAAEGREELAEALRGAGAAVTVLLAYQMKTTSSALLEGVLGRLRKGELDVLTFFAPSQVSALMSALGDGAAATLNRAGRIAAIGATTAEALRHSGVRVDLVPLAPSADALAQAIVDSYRNPEAH
jgi:uroporphyrinogen III methyltransferase/synthase